MQSYIESQQMIMHVNFQPEKQNNKSQLLGIV